MTRSTGTLIKFTAFGVVMAVLTAFLFLVFNETRTGDMQGYSAVFADASRLEAGDTVRIAGIRVGTVENVSLLPDRAKRPSREMASFMAAAVCPSKRCTSLPVLASHMRTMPSLHVVNTNSPFGV